MNLQFQSDKEYLDFKQALTCRIGSREIREIDKRDFSKAAVMILISNKDNEASVLVTKRTEKVSTHKGQMALPGGSHDSTDNNILDTALRETHEEMGIEPGDIEIAGEFDEYLSIAGFHVKTFVGFIPHPYEFKPNHDEIDTYIEVPLSVFAEKQYFKVQRREFEGKLYKIYHYLYNSHEIWGLTAAILTDFAGKIVNAQAGNTAQSNCH